MVGHEPARPAAMCEPAVPILTGMPRRLDHPIQRHVLDHDQAAHSATPSLTALLLPGVPESRPTPAGMTSGCEHCRAGPQAAQSCRRMLFRLISAEATVAECRQPGRRTGRRPAVSPEPGGASGDQGLVGPAHERLEVVLAVQHEAPGGALPGPITHLLPLAALTLFAPY